MAPTNNEKRLLKRVKDGRLRTSLAAIRQAAENIWAADAPRIVQDYTDRGIAHSERLAGLAAKLLDANDGRRLSTQEMYLLLGGIYLHDIGMQCDVLKYPAIKARAEKLGAQFDIEFKAPTTGGYSIDEQKAIRQNHHYLSAAWIDHAFLNDETVLSPAAQTIPDYLVGDLMEVCQYHFKLPIGSCAREFKIDPSQRKQLVAALLRFADELDVDGQRVSIATVRNFRLDPRNSVYWWLHHLTKVIFSARNIIVLNVRLHPNDAQLHGPFIYDAFINEFNNKNSPVLGVLRQNNISIAISADSKVIEHEHVEPLPPEIVQTLQEMQSATRSTSPGPAPTASATPSAQSIPPLVQAPSAAAKHNILVINHLLTVALSETDLDTLCSDCYRDVYDSFDSELSKTGKTHLLLDYCKKRDLIDELRRQVEEKTIQSNTSDLPRS